MIRISLIVIWWWCSFNNHTTNTENPPWKFDLQRPGLVYDALISDNAACFVVMCDSPKLMDRVICLDKDKGTFRWKSVPIPFTKFRTIKKNQLVATAGNKLVQVDLQSGKTTCVWKPPSQSIITTVVYQTLSTLVCTHHFSGNMEGDYTTFFLLDSSYRSTDSLVYYTSKPNPVMEEPVSGIYDDHTGKFFLMGGGRIHQFPFTEEKSRITIVDFNRRTIEYSIFPSMEMNYAGLSPIVSGDSVWVHNGWDRISCFSLHGTEIWHTRLDSCVLSAPKSWLKWGRHLITDSGNNGIVQVVNASTGKVVMQIKTGHSSFGSEWVRHRRLLIHTNSNGIFSLKITGDSVDYSPITHVEGGGYHQALCSDGNRLYTAIGNELICFGLSEKDSIRFSLK